MNQSDVVVIDYGMGNLLSVRRGLEHCGATVQVSSDPDVIYHAARVVLPGVGAFAHAMGELKRLQLDEVIRAVAHRGTPLLGICLGMQLLLDESQEFGHAVGLGLITGQVVPIPTLGADGGPLKVPHIGWNMLRLPNDGIQDWGDTLLQDIKPGETVYFVHSFMAQTKDSAQQIAECRYGDLSVCATIASNNIHGCQFHPEKSGITGLKILSRFLAL